MKTKIICLIAAMSLCSGVAVAKTTKASKIHDKLVQNNLYSPLIMASPYIGKPAYDGSDLISSWSSTNEDLTILQQNQQVENFLKKSGTAPISKPVLYLSGNVEGQVSKQQDYDHQAISSIDLSNAELDLLAEINSWSSAFIAFTYDDSCSSVCVDKAFLTLGNLNKSPFYASIGQMVIPFGVYSNYIISSPLTKSLAKTKQQAVLLGYSKNNLYASTYVFKGDSHVKDKNTINNWGTNLGYKFTFKKLDTDVGVGYIKNIADSLGMQDTGASDGYFQGFANDSGSGSDHENLKHQVSAIDLHANLTFDDHYHLINEYITALQPFDKNDLSFNGKGAKVSAMDTEFAFSHDVYNKPSFIAVGYGTTWQALGLNLPKHSLMGSIGTSLWQNTVEMIEFKHDINYGHNNTSAGGGSKPINPEGSHKNNNSITLQIDYYF